MACLTHPMLRMFFDNICSFLSTSFSQLSYNREQTEFFPRLPVSIHVAVVIFQEGDAGLVIVHLVCGNAG